MTARTVAALTSEITSDFADNTTGLITPALLRTVTQDVVDSTSQGFATPPNTQTGATYAVASDFSIIANRAGTVTLTLPDPTTCVGRMLWIKTIQAQTVVSNASNVIPLNDGAAGTAILAATAGKWAFMQSDGVNWNILAGN